MMISVFRLLLAAVVVVGCGPDSAQPLMPAAAASSEASTASLDLRELPARTWVPRPLAEGLSGPIPNPDGAKHSRVIFD